MKTRIVLLLIIVFSVNHFGCAQDKVLNLNEVPTEITSYVKQHFPERTILQAVKDKDDLSYTIEIVLDDATKLDFSKKNEVIEIESKTKLPDTVIPEKILIYVNTNYSNVFIKSWELDKKNQKVELNNGIDLKFSLSGDFLRID